MSINGIALNTSIKNTFIDLRVPSSDCPQLRRSNSVPPGLRLLTPTNDIKPVDIKSVDPFMLQRGETWADASTDDSEEEGLSPADSVQGFDTDTDGGSTCGMACANVEGSPRSPQAQPVTPLSSKAAPWQPQACRMVVQDPLPYTFGQEAARMVTALKKAVDESELAWEVEVVNQASGWFISVQVKEVSVSDKVATIAKEALLHSASNSSCTYVLGYLRQPFTCRPNGFNATLGAMRDETQACWATYEKGFCRHPGCCKYLHPRCTMQLNVELWM